MHLLDAKRKMGSKMGLYISQLYTSRKLMIRLEERRVVQLSH
jgi:hypothetical protein